MADSQIRALARRLARLERQALQRKQPSLAHSSIDDGALSATDSDGNLTMIIGVQPDGTNTTTVVAGPPPPRPSGVSAQPGFGLVVGRWDGTFEDDVLAPYDFARAEFHVSSIGPDFAPNVVGVGGLTLRATAESPRGGSVTINDIPPGVPMWLKVVIRSQSGKFSEPSEAIPFTAARVHGTNDVEAGTISDVAISDLALTVKKFKTSTHMLY